MVDFVRAPGGPAGSCRVETPMQAVYDPFYDDSPKCAKLKRMKEMLHEWSGGLLDEIYWQDLEAGRI